MHQILEILTENLYKKDVFFVFPTEIAASTWLEKLVTQSINQSTPIVAVAKERFISWDNFKSESIKSRIQNARAIPSVMRKIFAESLIEQNKSLIQQNEEPLFKEIINPQYAELSSSFTDWIASLLPQLKAWKELHDSHSKNPGSEEELSPVEKDYLSIYYDYYDFLGMYDLFEPAWETPPFNNDGKHFIIFFPESLQDFNEYQKLLSSSEHITLVTTQDIIGSSSQANFSSKAILFDNSPEELHNIALQIKDLVENQHIPYQEIAVSLTDVETYLPYIEKEFKKFAIPYNTRIGKPLSHYESGKLFSQIQKCYTDNFSFTCLRNLLTNSGLPWKEPNLAKELIQFGIANNCVCSYTKDGNTCYPFEEAFKNEFCDELIKNFYYSLKSIIVKMNTSNSFEQIIKLYWEFKEFFFYKYDSETQTDTQKEMDLILGRAVSELVSLQKLQDEFEDVPITNPFAFFVKMVDSKEYLPQAQSLGICIYPYQVVAAAPFSVHIIPNASQKQLTVTYYNLRFLPQNLKEKFCITDTDVSETFLKMYQCSSFNKTLLTIANNSYNGYSIPHSALQAEKHTNNANYSNFDYHQNEKSFVIGESNQLQAITQTQQNALFTWAKTASKNTTATETNDSIATNNSIASDEQKADNSETTQDFPQSESRIKAKLLQNDSLRISASLLKQFALCKKKVVFQKLLNLYEEQTDSTIDDDKKLGTFYHKVLESFFAYHNQKGLQITQFQSKPQNYELLKQYIQSTFEEFKLNPINKMLFFARLNGIEETLVAFLTNFTKTFAGFTVSFVEQELSSRAPFPATNSDSFFYLGIIDLVLTTETETVIVDYKTRATPTLAACYPNEQNELADFQMAMYTYLLTQKYPATTVTQMCFASINEAKIYEIYPSSKKFTEDNILHAINTMHSYSRDLTQFLAASPLDLTVPKNNKECSSCKYQPICRTKYTVSRD